jgi:hypothetical protein
MKVSGSILCSAIAAAYLAAHLPFLAPSLEDIDSINFALGLREFDVARHQPHPPGYPVYIALGRASLLVVNIFAPSLEQARAEALALAIWSAIAGAVALASAFVLFSAIEPPGPGSRRAPLWAVALLAVSPLFWISGLRPMSDLPGLALAVAAQALLVLGWKDPRRVALAALVAGLAAGIRVQTLWLSAPLLGAVVVRHRRLGTAWLITRPVAAAVAGCLLWFVPLLSGSGGLTAYLRALGSQAGEDFAWVDMLLVDPTPRHLAFALSETFVLPWGSLPLAAGIGVAATAGLVVAWLQARRALVMMTVAFAPYALFHLLLQETPHVRYALPVLPLVAWLAARAVANLGRFSPVAGIALVLLAVSQVTPSTLAYAGEPHPAFRAIADMAIAAAVDRPAAIYAHYALRRPLQAQQPAAVPFVEPPRTSEWTGLVAYWRGGGTAPVWFLADPRRTDLALIDPQSRRDVRAYRWMAADRWELSGTRPTAVDWYRLQPPGWFADEGWSLTPELGGVTRLAGTGVDRQPIEALVRRRGEAMIAIVGARHLGTANDGGASFSLAIDGAVVDQWELDPAAGPNVLREIRLPAGVLAGAGGYARLTITARSTIADRPTPPVAIRQFDVQPATGLIAAFADGWHEQEYDNATGLSWRWSSARSVLRILPPQAVDLRLAGESPLKYLAAAPTVRITAADRVLSEQHPADNFEWSIRVSEDDARAADGRIVIETDPVYLPGRAEGTSDVRQLGLRVFEIEVNPVSP